MNDLAQFAIELFDEFNGEEGVLWKYILEGRVVLIDYGEGEVTVDIVDRPVRREDLAVGSGLKFVYFKSGEDEMDVFVVSKGMNVDAVLEVVNDEV